MKHKFEDHTGLIWMVVNRLREFGRIHNLEDEDLFQAGSIGLLHAIERFDPSKGFEFSTYATHCIKMQILREIRNFRHSVKIPRQIWEVANVIRWKRLHDLTTEDIARILNTTVAIVEQALEIIGLHVISINKVKYLSDWGKDLTYADMIPLHDDETILDVRTFIDNLPERERMIITMRLQGYSQVEIAKEFGIDQPYVSRILRRIGRKYQQYLSA